MHLGEPIQAGIHIVRTREATYEYSVEYDKTSSGSESRGLGIADAGYTNRRVSICLKRRVGKTSPVGGYYPKAFSARARP